MRILLIEDEASLADVLARNLRAHGHDTVIAGSAEAALDAIDAGVPDALILDINLPDLTGWDVLRRLTPAQRGTVRVIIISAAPVSQKRIEEFSPDVTLQKPFPIGALLRALAPEAAQAVPGEGQQS
ncbi:MAG TPA: response regulator [Dehalococcoidia bacterium]|jgi:two-component system response regulator MprA|nr:response regulator [Dehalococcoidia bacterium]